MNLFKGLCVLSLEQATVLPYLTYRLVQDGMNVIRLEHPTHGDPNRMIGDKVLGEERMNAYFLCINAGKKALSLNLAEPEGRSLFHSLVRTLPVDIFATNQLPRNYPKLGIDYDSLNKIKPDLIWLGVTGFGPDSNEGAYDPILQARSGLMELTGEGDGEQCRHQDAGSLHVQGPLRAWGRPIRRHSGGSPVVACAARRRRRAAGCR
jgi:formyl-CoA transferase